MKVLFICNANLNRSPTAELLFKDRYETKSAGMSELSKQEVNKELLEWADVVIVMEDWMRTELSERFPKECMKKKIISLDIPDIYHFNQPELVAELEKKIGELESKNII